MKEPGRPPPSHPPSAVRLLRGGRRARSLYCKPSEQRGNGEDDDDGDEDGNDEEDVPYGRGARRSRKKQARVGRTASGNESGENGRYVRKRSRSEKERGATEWEARARRVLKRAVSAIAGTKIVSRELGRRANTIGTPTRRTNKTPDGGGREEDA